MRRRGARRRRSSQARPYDDGLTAGPPARKMNVSEFPPGRHGSHGVDCRSARPSRRQFGWRGGRRARELPDGDPGRSAADRARGAGDSAGRGRGSRPRGSARDSRARGPHVRRVVRRPAPRPAPPPPQVLQRDLRRGGAGARHQLQQHVRAPHAAVHGHGPRGLSARRSGGGAEQAGAGGGGSRPPARRSRNA